MILEAAVWAACGVAIAVAPRFVLVTMFDLPPLPDQGYVRIAGVFAFSLSLLMVLVARRLDDAVVVRLGVRPRDRRFGDRGRR